MEDTKNVSNKEDIEDRLENIKKPKKTGWVLTVFGAIWILRSLVFMVLDIYKIALIVSIIISIIGGIMVLKDIKPGRLISLLSGILTSILFICVVYNPAFWFYDFWYGLLNHFIFMFLHIYGFAIFGIPFLLLLIGGILSFKNL